MIGLLIGGLGENSHEGVYPIELIIGDHHEEGGVGFPDCKKVIIGRLPFKGGKESWASLKRQVIMSGIMMDCLIVN
jgi:hypothetical protein